MSSSLNSLIFDNQFVAALPADPSQENRPRRVRGAVYSRVQPTAVSNPTLVALSAEVAQMLELDPNAVSESELAQVLSGNVVLPGMDPHAVCYGGHQFGNWAGQLGDGRAINLGEVKTQRGDRLALQLKGAGPTPYSRMADGRAVMRSSIREFLCSEAMHHLGVPTTRALSLVSTGDAVVRDMFYTGDRRPEPGAIVCRVAPSFLRFGNFEIFAAHREHDLLKQLVDYAIANHFPDLQVSVPEDYAQLLERVCLSTAAMVTHWMRVGFVHGVMNTDNMSLLGLTIDYGPYGWLEDYEPNWTPNTTDAHGRRYCFGNQPHIAGWNLVRLAHALYPLVGSPEPLQAAIDQYGKTLDAHQHAMIAQKLGVEPRQGEGQAADAALFDDLLKILQLQEIDMTIFFRNLAKVPREGSEPSRCAPLAEACYDAAGFHADSAEVVVEWLRRYQLRLDQDARPDSERIASMNQANPKYVLRNYLAQLAIDDVEKGDSTRLLETLDVMRRPYDEQPGREEYAQKRPEWARNRPGCSMLSCSS